MNFKFYLFHFKATCDKLTSRSFSSGCGGLFTGPSGQIVSPGWPNAYPHNQDCIYTITVQALKTVLFNITHFHLEDHPSCDYDYLEVSSWKKMVKMGFSMIEIKPRNI